MKLIYKILIANIIIAVVITTIALLLTGSGYSSGDDTAVAFGIVCLGIGILNLFVGFILLFTQLKAWGSGMLLSSAVLLLLSGISCSQGFNLH